MHKKFQVSTLTNKKEDTMELQKMVNADTIKIAEDIIDCFEIVVQACVLVLAAATYIKTKIA